MRVFKNKWFNRWARDESISDAVLLNAAAEIATGKVEADLGGCLFKKRLPRTGGGKSGGYRVVVGYKKHNTERIIFLYAFAKNDKANMSAKEEAALSLTAESFISATDKQVQVLLKIDGFVKSPHAALRRILRHCSVPQVRFIPQDLRALPANILRSRLKIDFLRGHQKLAPYGRCYHE